MDKLKIRKYEDEDYEKYLFQIEKENMKSFVDKYEGGWEDDSEREAFYRMLKEGHTYTLTLGNEAIGFFALIKLDNEPVIFIKNFQVKKGLQGRGIGSKVLDFIEKRARKLNCKSIELSVFKDNPALDFYKKKGFTESKTKAKNKHAILMEKPVKN